jgi:hypothetical protein
MLLLSLSLWCASQSMCRPTRCLLYPPSRRIQGGLRIKKKYPGSFFFFKPLGLDLPTYVIMHIAIYGNVTSSS